MNAEYIRLKKKTEQLVNLRIEGELSKEELATFYKPVEVRFRQIEAQIPVIQAGPDFYKI